MVSPIHSFKSFNVEGREDMQKGKKLKISLFKERKKIEVFVLRTVTSLMKLFFSFFVFYKFCLLDEDNNNRRRKSESETVKQVNLDFPLISVNSHG